MALVAAPTSLSCTVARGRRLWPRRLAPRALGDEQARLGLLLRLGLHPLTFRLAKRPGMSAERIPGHFGFHFAEYTGASGFPFRQTRMLDLKKSTVYRPPPIRSQKTRGLPPSPVTKQRVVAEGTRNTSP